MSSLLFTYVIGGTVIWLIKGCKTKWKDEIHSDAFTTLLVGLIVSFAIVVLILILMKADFISF